MRACLLRLGACLWLAAQALSAQNGRVCGYVTDLFGAPIRDAWIDRTEPLLNVKTDAGGHYCIDLQTGREHTLMASVPGFHREQRTISFRKDNPRLVVNFGLRVGIIEPVSCGLKNKIVSPEGKAIAGVEVRIHSLYNSEVAYTTRSKRDGSFSFDSISPARYKLEARGRGIEGAEKMVDVAVSLNKPAPDVTLVTRRR
jgi:hypothetical protein